jgi:aspartyl-tRNA synthetase
LLRDSTFEAFKGAASDPESRVVALRVPDGVKFSRKQLDEYGEFVKKYGLKGLSYLKVNDRALGLNGLQSSLLKFFSEPEITSLLNRVHAVNGDIIFFAAGKATVVNSAFAALRVQLGNDCNLITATWCPVWVVDFPMFDKTETGWTFMHHPFTAPAETDLAKILADPGAVLARAYDLVLNGTELGGGSIRIDNQAMQETVFKVLAMSTEQFSHLIESFKFGYPPEGGIAFGLDRIVMLMCGADSIRDVIAFPKTTTGACPLTQAPSPVGDAQLRELGITVKASNNYEL